MNYAIRSEPRALASLLVGMYVWAVVAFFGVTLVDTAYVAVLRDSLGAEERAAVFSEVGDFLLLVFFATVLAALAAIGSCWRSAGARNFVVASVLVVVLEPPVLEVLGPLLAGSNLGPLLRIPGMAVASALALLGFARLVQGAPGIQRGVLSN
jgi:hypothetical protein